MNSTVNSLLLIYFLLQLGYLFSLGFYSAPGVYILLGTLLIWLAYHLKTELFKKFLNFSPIFIPYLVLVSSIALSLISFEPILKQSGVFWRPENFLQLFWIMKILFAMSLVTAIFCFYLKNLNITFGTLFLMSLTLQILMIIISPNPRIDTFDLLRLGSLGLIQGTNPYQMNFIPIYHGVKPDYFAYGPGILFFTTPFVILTGDPRYFFVFAKILTAIILYKLLKKTAEKEYKFVTKSLPLIYLFNPTSLYIVSQSWLDPGIILIFGIFTFLIINQKKGNLAYILLGIPITFKQTMIFAPFFFLKWLKQKKLLLLTFTTAFVIITPFFIWSPQDFLQDAVVWYLKYPIRHDGLTVNSLFFSLTKKDIPTFAFSAIWITTAWLVLRKQRGTLDQSFSTMALWFFTFFLFNKLAFANYYYFVSSLILISLTVTLTSSPKLPTS